MKNKDGFFSDLDYAQDVRSMEKGSDFFSDLPEPPSALKSLALTVPRAIMKAAKSIPFRSPSMIPEKMQKRLLEEEFPIRQEHEPIERALKIATELGVFPASMPMRAAEAVGGAALGELAEKSGLGEFGQSIAEGVGAGIPGLLKIAGSVPKAISKAFSSTTEKMPSGLTKIGAVESKLSKMGSLSKERQKVVVEKLNKEASDLAQKSIEKHLPAVDKLKKNANLDLKFKEDFGKLKKVAEKANPDVDITPISELMKETTQKYRGIPNPSSEAKSIINEIKYFMRKPQTGLGNLLKIYRDNGKKMKHVYETAMTGGRQEEYVNFLKSMNNAISQSFERTFPAESAWLNQFKRLNREFKEIKNAESTLLKLKGVLSENPRLAELDKLISDVKTQEKLRLSMGNEGSQEIIQIASDLKRSRDALKKMPSKEFSKFDHAFPLYYLIPFVGKAIGAYKTVKAGRYFYGWLLSTPSRRKAYSEALNAFSKSDLEGYKKATAVLKKELDSKED